MTEGKKRIGDEDCAYDEEEDPHAPALDGGAPGDHIHGGAEEVHPHQSLSTYAEVTHSASIGDVADDDQESASEEGPAANQGKPYMEDGSEGAGNQADRVEVAADGIVRSLLTATL